MRPFDVDNNFEMSIETMERYDDTYSDINSHHFKEHRDKPTTLVIV